MNPYQPGQPEYQAQCGNPLPMDNVPTGGIPAKRSFTPDCPQVPGFPQATVYPNQEYQPNQGFQNAPQYPMPAQAGFPEAATGFLQPTTGFSQPNTGFSQPPTGFSQLNTGFPQSTTGYLQPTTGIPQSNPNQGYQSHHGNAMIPKVNPTVVPAHPFDPREDAAVLHKAMKWLGTNETAIINVLTKRTSDQRQKIASEYLSVHEGDLIADLKSETGDKFADLLEALMTTLPQFHAKELHDAIAGVGTDEDILIEILCSLSNREINAVKEAYNIMYRKPLESDLRGDTSGWFKKFLTTLCEAKRSEDYVVDQAKAKADAQKLHEAVGSCFAGAQIGCAFNLSTDRAVHLKLGVHGAGKLRLGSDESEFKKILCSRSIPQLQAIFDEYGLLARHDIDAAINSRFSANIAKALGTLVRIVRNKPAYFAEQLQKSMKGMGTNDRQLIRIMATRCEIDLRDIAEMFKFKYDKTLGEWIKVGTENESDCSGYYQKCLLALLGD